MCWFFRKKTNSPTFGTYSIQMLWPHPKWREDLRPEWFLWSELPGRILGKWLINAREASKTTTNVEFHWWQSGPLPESGKLTTVKKQYHRTHQTCFNLCFFKQHIICVASLCPVTSLGPLRGQGIPSGSRSAKFLIFFVDQLPFFAIDFNICHDIVWHDQLTISYDTINIQTIWHIVCILRQWNLWYLSVYWYIEIDCLIYGLIVSFCDWQCREIYVTSWYFMTIVYNELWCVFFGVGYWKLDVYDQRT